MVAGVAYIPLVYAELLQGLQRSDEPAVGSRVVLGGMKLQLASLVSKIIRCCPLVLRTKNTPTVVGPSFLNWSMPRRAKACRNRPYLRPERTKAGSE